MDRQPDSPPAFDAVRLRYRRDGWTPERQRAFIAFLWRERCILAACRHVGKSAEAAYKLFRHPEARSFRAAWNEALARPRPRSAAPPRTLAPERPRPAAAPARPSSTSAGRVPGGGTYSLAAFSRAARASVGGRFSRGGHELRQLHQLRRGGHQLPPDGTDGLALPSAIPISKP